MYQILDSNGLISDLNHSFVHALITVVIEKNGRIIYTVFYSCSVSDHCLIFMLKWMPS